MWLIVNVMSLWVRPSFHVVDVISVLQEGSSAAAAIDQSARHVSSREESVRTRPRLDDEALVKPREAAESSQRVAVQARARSVQHLN